MRGCTPLKRIVDYDHLYEYTEVLQHFAALALMR